MRCGMNMIALLLTIFFCLGTLCVSGCSQQEDQENSNVTQDKEIDVCGIVSQDELSQLYKKPLIAKKDGNGCIWSLKPDGMAYLHIAVQEKSREIREYFNQDLPEHIKLEAIEDLGDEGLMTVVEGSLGVIILAKKNNLIRSSATFLDIEPGSSQQQTLWHVYQRILDKI